MESKITSWRQRLHRLRLEPGQIAELEQHLRDTVDELLIKGYDEERAFEMAVKRIGNPKTIAKQEWNVNGKRQRRSHMPALVPVYFTQAWRQLKRSRLHTLITMSGLVLGLAGCILLAIYVKFERSYDRFHPDHDRIYRVLSKRTIQGTVTENLMSPINLAHNLEASIGGVAAATSFNIPELMFSTDEAKRFRMRALTADSSFNDIFRFPLADGRNIPDPDPDGVYITREIAQRLFGVNDPVGKSLTWHTNPNREMIVRGVLADIPGNSHFDFDLVVPSSIADHTEPGPVIWQASNGAKTYVKLAQGMAVPDMVEQLHAFQNATGSDTATKLDLQPLAEIHLTSDLRYEFKVNGDHRTIYLFAMVSLLILLIACVNYAIISMSRYARRIRELGMRKVLGASRSALALQFATECLIQLAIVVPLALLLTWLLLPEFGQLMGRSFGPLLPEYLGVVAATVSIVTVCVLVAGVYPALPLHANHAMESLHGRAMGRLNAGWMQKVAVTTQFAITAFLLVYLGGIQNQMHFVRKADLGYNPDHLMHIRLNSRAHSKIMKTRLLDLPGVTAASTSAWLPGKSSSSSTFPHPSGQGDVRMESVSGDEDLLAILGIRLVEGRNFDPSNPSDTLDLSSTRLNFDNLSKYPVLLNRHALEVLELSEPVIGTEFKKPNFHGRVVGLVDEVKFFSLREAAMPMVFKFSDRTFGLLVKYAPGQLRQTLDEIERIYEEVTGSTAMEVIFIDEHLRSLYEAERRETTLITASVVLALTLSVMGLLGMIVFALEQRTKEIGIRKVLGASMSQIVWLLTRRYVVLITVGSAIGLPFAHWLLQDWLAGFAYRAVPGFWLYAGAVAVALAVAWLVIGLQAGKAALENPVKALRSE